MDGSPAFLSFCVQRLSDLLRDALPFLLTLCLRVTLQRGIAQFCCLTGPYLKLALGHQPASDAGEIFFVRPLVNFPDIVILYLASEAAACADLTSGLAVLPRCSSGLSSTQYDAGHTVPLFQTLSG